MDNIKPAEKSFTGVIEQSVGLSQAHRKVLGMEYSTFKAYKDGAMSVCYLTMTQMLLNPLDRLKTIS